MDGGYAAPIAKHFSRWVFLTVWARKVSHERMPLALRPLRLTHQNDTSSRSPSLTGRTTSTVAASGRSEEHTSELQSRENLVCRLLLEKKKQDTQDELTHT